MNCASCGKSVPDKTTICPHCEAVLDESILGEFPGKGDEVEDTPLPDRPAPQDAEAQINEIWSDFRRMVFEDKLTVVSAAVLFVFSFMPWSATSASQQMGFLTWGLLTAVLAGVAIGSVWARAHRKDWLVGRERLPYAAAGAGGGAALIALAYGFVVFRVVDQELGGYVVTSWPEFGCYITFLAGVGVLLGSTLLIRARRSPAPTKQ